MLTLTRKASDIVSTIVAKRIQSDDAGLRIKGPIDGNYAIVAVPTGKPGDEIVETGDARIYLEESAAFVLEGKVLDALVTDDGHVQFHLAHQDPQETAEDHVHFELAPEDAAAGAKDRVPSQLAPQG